MKDTDLGKQLLHVIPRTMNHIRCEIRAQAKSELTVPQFRILAQLALNPSTNSRLAEWMGVSVPAMSRMVDGLARRGWVERTRGETDRRQVEIRLTPKGQALHGKIWAAAQGKLALRVAPLTAEQKASLDAGLSVLQEMFR